jgi:AraC-like DNA-binding protein
MDALSDVLNGVRLTGAVFFDLRLSSPWAAETPRSERIVASLFPASDHLIPYHVVAEGTCFVWPLDGPAMPLEAGDIIIFPHGDGHVMSSAPGTPSAPEMSLYRRPTDQQLPFTVTMGESGGTPGRVLCGYLACDARPFNPLLAALPPMIRVSDRSGGLLDAFVRFAVAEATTPSMGGESTLARLSELMFVEAVRRYLETLPPEHSGWLAGLRDVHVGRALTALHQHSARAWTLEQLAREAGLSRSALAERFVALVGQPPMQYLASWRMQLAAGRLAGGTDGVAAIAQSVGYESEASFSRAFKKAVGMAPGEWRKHRATARGAAAVVATGPSLA